MGDCKAHNLSPLLYGLFLSKRRSRRTEIVKTEKTITTKELAEQLHTSSKVILENAKKCLPNKIIENGKVTLWTQEEVTILLDCLKNNSSNHASDLYFQSKANTSTEMTPVLKIRKAMELMQEGYEEELAILRAKAIEQQKIIEEQTPKVEFFDDVAGSSDTIDMKEVAKVLNVKGLGRNNLFELLRNRKVLDRNNQPYQKFVDSGYFRIIESRYTLPTGEVKISLKTVVFQKGLAYIRKLIAG